MKRFFSYTILSFFLLLLPTGQASANNNDSIRLSLLTCAPGEEIYSLFGHTAIPVSYTHLDVYKRQLSANVFVFTASSAYT